MFILAYDLGTGGIKAALYGEDLSTAAELFVEYSTFYPEPEMHEQDPGDWWQAVCKSTRLLLKKTGTPAESVAGVALSGASLVAIPLNKAGQPLLSRVPIWSDMRAEAQAKAFFQKIPEEKWYLTTGNGFPPACYSIFKLMWLQEKQPEIFARTALAVGSKDYINYLLTGRLLTDFSYASGTGAFDLRKNVMRTDFLRAAGLPEDIFPSPVPSHEQVGTVTRKAAAESGLPEGIPVFCGGVDNACMAMGAAGVEEGKAYVSLGSSAWIPLNCREPVLDTKTRPYTFAHIQQGMYTSAYSLFAGGNSLRWARDVLFPELEKNGAYEAMNKIAERAAVGANGVLFHPGLAGGTMQDPSPYLRGAFMNLQLSSGRQDLLRAVLEGVAMNLSLSLKLLREKAEIKDPILFCGGGSKSPVWMQIFADTLNVEIEKTSVDQSAASLGAAAIAARGLGWWKDYSPIRSLHKPQRYYKPNPENTQRYQKLLPLFEQMSQAAASLGNAIQSKS